MPYLLVTFQLRHFCQQLVVLSSSVDLRCFYRQLVKPLLVQADHIYKQEYSRTFKAGFGLNYVGEQVRKCKWVDFFLQRPLALLVRVDFLLVVQAYQSCAITSPHSVWSKAFHGLSFGAHSFSLLLSYIVIKSTQTVHCHGLFFASFCVLHMYCTTSTR